MEVFVARQPLFNRMEQVTGYEVLYRNNEVNAYPPVNGDHATADVIVNSFLNIGIDKLADGKPCFINFTENLLEWRLATYFKPSDLVIEILESVKPSQKIIDICKELKQLGYKIALDKYNLDYNNQFAMDLLLISDMVKIDFQETTDMKRNQLECIAKFYQKEMVAEKLESEEEYLEAMQKGYHYFQGYYFSRPAIVSAHDVPTYVHTYLEILELIKEDSPDLDLITILIERDISLSFKLLKLLNTSELGFKRKVTSIRQAIDYIGILELQKWLYILAVRENNSGNGISQEVMKNCLIRSKMCEYIAKLLPARLESGCFFLIGMCSLMDVILDIPLENVLSQLPLDENITSAFTGEDTIYRNVLNLVIAAETANWQKIGTICSMLHIQEKDLFKVYAESINWVKQLNEFRNFQNSMNSIV